ncbi:hypothetical protein FDC50_07385 [Clostridium botulinum]|nr:hypothetical protein [Clostridium botulinum]NFL09896.1 hypothetical protein [Clostridium botulinum]NFP07481.1 hypothetical protein [Clostridium botulinum]NFP16622.1 hypothetical protein [Clostridium botulinum]
MNNVDKYLNSILKKLDLPYKEKQDLKLQFKDHILTLQDNYISEGYNSDEACKLAIESFNNTENFSTENFNDNSSNLSYMARIFAFIILIVDFIMFITLFNTINRVHYINTLKDLIPFNYIYIAIKDIIHGHNISNVQHITNFRIISLFFCALMGFLIPIIINKLNSCIPTLKICTIGIILFELIFDNHRNVDFVIFPILACLLGYFILKTIIIIPKSLNNKKADRDKARRFS